ncbi:MAG: ASKHA domain-containing protein [Actinomycetota bacterium]|nr:ASKHA domain-containing protein [Actinomycetota bacterium]
MRKHAVTYHPSGKMVHAPEGTTLFNAAHWAGLPIDSTCGGRGTCGKCGVKILSGHADRTLADYRHLSDKLDEGWRLSCQAIIGEDTECEVPRLMRSPKAATMGVGRFVLLEPNVRKLFLKLEAPSMEDPRSHLKRLEDALVTEGIEVRHSPTILPTLALVLEEGVTDVTATLVGEHLIDVEQGDTRARMFGISFDIGTTTVVATLVDLTNGAAAAVGSTINRQAPFGADVIARMGHAMTGPDAIEQLRIAVMETVNALIAEVCESAEVDASREVYECVVVGNATMLHLLLGVDPRSIALSPFVATFLEQQDLEAAEAGFAIHADGRVAMFPSIGAYVGADIVGDIVATGLARDRERRLLVDVGTNGEIAVGNEDRVVATSAPAGPAFEGGQILHGMRATDGAIEGVVLTNGVVELQVIGGDIEPRGLCGSGLIDVVAQLRLAGLLLENGVLRSRDELAAEGHPLAAHVVDRDGVKAFALTDAVLLTQLDIRELQSAKGAISTGIEVAMNELGVTAGDLDEVMLAGSFGTYINPQSARVVGLVPPVPVERIKAVGNTASEGAKMALLSFREREVAFELPGFVEYLELSGAPDFNERFIANLGFPPLEGLVAPGIEHMVVEEAAS